MRHRMLALAFALLSWSCVTADGDLDCEQGRCDDAPVPTVCDAQAIDLSGRDRERVLGHLDDPLVRKVFRAATSCPTTFAELADVLERNDNRSCTFGGNVAHVVSERSQLLGRPDTYRAVVSRPCDDREPFGLMFSMFGARLGAPLPEDVEVMAFDESRGVFNYYALEDGIWKFFGDSRDLLDGPGDDDRRRCAGCHRTGGPIMKELTSPWMHWDGNADIPGASQLVGEHPVLGGPVPATVTENMVRTGIDAWTPQRVAHQRDHRPTAQLLRPLFCTDEVNLRADNVFAARPLDRVTANFTLDPFVASSFFSGIDATASDYAAAIAAGNQRVVDRAGQQLVDAGGEPITDLRFQFAYPVRAFADTRYIEALIAAGVIDRPFALAVLSVDFTQPLFSPARCALLEFAPDLAPGARSAAAIRAGFVDALRAASPAPSSAAGALLEALEAADGADLVDRARRFVDACRARPPAAFMADAVAVISLLRDKARKLTLLEFAETLPVDDRSMPQTARLDPVGCELVLD
jgi:hypothetical protein